MFFSQQLQISGSVLTLYTDSESEASQVPWDITLSNQFHSTGHARLGRSMGVSSILLWSQLKESRIQWPPENRRLLIRYHAPGLAARVILIAFFELPRYIPPAQRVTEVFKSLLLASVSDLAD